MTEEEKKVLQEQLAALEANSEQLKKDLEAEKAKSTKFLSENTVLRKELEQGKVETKTKEDFDSKKFLDAFYKSK